MADKGPFLTSCIIFYLSIGAAIFQILEEPNWKSARDKYVLQKENILKSYPCLDKEDLENILKVDLLFFPHTWYLAAPWARWLSSNYECCLIVVLFCASVSGEFLPVLSRRSCRDLHARAAQNQFFLLGGGDTSARSSVKRHVENTQMSPLGMKLLCCFKPSFRFHLRSKENIAKGTKVPHSRKHLSVCRRCVCSQ